MFVRIRNLLAGLIIGMALASCGGGGGQVAEGGIGGTGISTGTVTGFGSVYVNGVKYDIYLPHGGIKNSGIGVDCSTYALDDYLIKKRVTKALV